MTRAFTLAEVLITFAIIGVVAALTIPTLISNNNKRIVETRLAKFYSTINQAIELSEVENGPKEKWDLIPNNSQEAIAWFNKYLKPYIIASKTDYSDNEKVLVYYSDGSMLSFNRSGWDFFPKASDYNKTGPKNGIKNFIFLFSPASTSNNYKYHTGKGVEPYMYSWNGTETHLRNNATYGCNNDNYVRAFCTQLIRINGWKIPDDYPFKF